MPAILRRRVFRFAATIPPPPSLRSLSAAALASASAGRYYRRAVAETLGASFPSADSGATPKAGPKPTEPVPLAARPKTSKRRSSFGAKRRTAAGATDEGRLPRQVLRGVHRRPSGGAGPDVHKDSIDIATADPGRDGEVRHLGRIGGDLAALDKAPRKLISQGRPLQVVYEAGPCGLVIWWHLNVQGIDREAVASSSIPKRSGDRVKTDHRDAMLLSRLS